MNRRFKVTQTRTCIVDSTACSGCDDPECYRNLFHVRKANAILDAVSKVDPDIWVQTITAEEIPE